jgi:hypothetical protein
MFVKYKEQTWSWDGEKITSSTKLRLGLEPGFLITDAYKLDAMERYFPIWEVSNKYRLLQLNRVDAVLTVCRVIGKKIIPDKDKITSDLEIIDPSYIDSPVYLAKLFINNTQTWLS